MSKSIRILGIRGIPACHGGFETFAERLALYLVDKGWQVTVYCQEELEHGQKKAIHEDEWSGVRRVHVPVSRQGPLGTVIFDWLSNVHAAKSGDFLLTLGYNTALFNVLYRLKGLNNVINMDGIEWRRNKWSLPIRGWFFVNERFGCWLGNHLIADHPEIKKHLATRVAADKITTIPYGADGVNSADAAMLQAFGLTPGNYALVIARPEPENSILEIVSAFSRKRRSHKLVVLGHYDPQAFPYHKQVMDAASDDVVFVGAIYDQAVVGALRHFSRLYIHGHTVGGTNPSLVEAMGARSAVLAHNNRYNKWVAGPHAAYFTDEPNCSRLLDTLLENEGALADMRQASTARHAEMFAWNHILGRYEELLNYWHNKRPAHWGDSLSRLLKRGFRLPKRRQA